MLGNLHLSRSSLANSCMAELLSKSSEILSVSSQALIASYSKFSAMEICRATAIATSSNVSLSAGFVTTC